jgi:membrane fusion protein (multidrug efflux system)
MNRPKVPTLLLSVVALLLAAGLAAWAFGPEAWREAARERLGLLPTPRERPPTAVRVAPAARAAVDVTAAATGDLRAHEAIAIAPEVSGHIEAIHFTEGDRVAAGDLLLELVADEARARLRSAEAELREAELDLERARGLSTGQAIAAAEVDRLEARSAAARAQRDLAAARLAKHSLHAPFAGRVGLREASPGDLVTPQTPVAELYAVDPMELRFAVPGRLLGALRPGLELSASSDAFADETFGGRVRRIAPAVDRGTRQVEVEAELANADGRLRPGMFMQVRLVLERREDAVLVPEEALLRRGDARYVFVVNDDGRAERRAVSTGVERRGEIEIRDGVAAGERVVTGGVQRLGGGERVRIAGDDDGERPGAEGG